jgi:hypothetical protein
MSTADGFRAGVHRVSDELTANCTTTGFLVAEGPGAYVARLMSQVREGAERG